MVDDDLDIVIDRRNTNSHKWSKIKYDDGLAMGVADMDFRLPMSILSEIYNRIEYGIFGYEFEDDVYFESFIKWIRFKHSIEIKFNDIVCTPGIITGIKIGIQAFSNEGDAILLQVPVYHSYFDMILINERRIVKNKLIYENNEYHIDFKDFEDKIIKNNVKIFILCNPHNPIGKAWNYNEILKMVNICKKHSVIIISDEAFQDFVLPKKNYYSLMNFIDIYRRCLVVMSPCKTFNVAGLHMANFIIPDENLKNEFKRCKLKNVSNSNNAMAIAFSKALYTKGSEWIDTVVEYLRKNKKILVDYFSSNCAKVRIVNSDIVYFLWVNFYNCNISEVELEKILSDKMHVELIKGSVFGDEYGMFYRINIACSVEIIEEFIHRVDLYLLKYLN